MSERDDVRDSTWLLRLGLALTVVWVLLQLYYILAIVGFERFVEEGPPSVGGFLEGAFAPLAFLPFIFDVAFTLAHRARRGRYVLAAHNEHLYQLLVRMGGSHQSVTALYLFLTVISTTLAIVVNAFGTNAQFFSALVLAAFFSAGAIVIYRRAKAAGLLAGEPEREDAAPTENRSLPAAAE